AMSASRARSSASSGRAGRSAGASSRMNMTTGLADRADVAVVGAAAPAEDAQRGQEPEEPAIVLGQLPRVAGVELRRLVELVVAHPRGVGPHTADPLDPAAAGQHAAEMARMRAVDHVV